MKTMKLIKGIGSTHTPYGETEFFQLLVNAGIEDTRVSAKEVTNAFLEEQGIDIKEDWFSCIQYQRAFNIAQVFLLDTAPNDVNF
jgi:hypothetical protein